MYWYLRVLSKYAVFAGRARRKEYWQFFLVYLLFSILASLIDTMLDTFVIQGICLLFHIIPILAVGSRRLHDIGRSAWLLLLYLIPFLGPILLVAFFAQEGNKGKNPFGQDPKA